MSGMFLLTNDRLKSLKSYITKETITRKLKKPINKDSPISQTYKDEDEWLREKSQGWSKTIGGKYLQHIIDVTARIDGWMIQAVGT